MVELSTRPFILEPVLFRLRHSQSPQMWLRRSLANRLEEAQERFLLQKNKRFKILDAWRPRPVQAHLYAACWQAIADQHPLWDRDRIESAVAKHVSAPGEPGLIPSHTTGGAVDVIVTDEVSGQDEDMGWMHYLDWREEHPPLSAERRKIVRVNKRLLLIALQSVGLAQDPDMWWHFDYGNQKWAATLQEPVAIYDELGASGEFMKKGSAYGHGMLLPYEMK